MLLKHNVSFVPAKYLVLAILLLSLLATNVSSTQAAEAPEYTKDVACAPGERVNYFMESTAGVFSVQAYGQSFEGKGGLMFDRPRELICESQVCLYWLETSFPRALGHPNGRWDAIWVYLPAGGAATISTVWCKSPDDT
jgi:hypothetical protein